jgi:hypothetical protein
MTTTGAAPSSTAHDWRRRTPGVSSALALFAAATFTAAAAPPSGDNEHGAAVRRMIRPVLTAGEAVSSVRIERSDPFGGPPERERGRVWYVPGRGIRYKSETDRGQDMVADKSLDLFQIYSPSQRVVYKGPFERAPSRLQAIVLEPDDLLAKPLRAAPEKRRIGGADRPGYRLREGALGDSLREWSVWVGGDAKTGVLRWVSVASDIDTLSIEFERFTLPAKARLADLSQNVPRGTKVESLDAREIWKDGKSGRGEQRGREGESR